MIFSDEFVFRPSSTGTTYFIHIPKTAGSSLASQHITKLGHGFQVPGIYRTPASQGGWHGYTTEYWHQYSYKVPHHLKMTIVRNPFDLLCSYYHHGDPLLPDKQYSHSGWASVNYTHQFRSFEEFIFAYCDPAFKWHQPIFQQFLWSQLFNKEGNCVCDFIVKYEGMEKAFQEMNRVGYNIQNRNNNKSKLKTKSYKEYYTKEMREAVEKKCARELKVFRYDFHNTIDNSAFIYPTHLHYSLETDVLQYPDPAGSI